MSERRLLPTVGIDANAKTCGRCMYLHTNNRASWCGLFTGSLDTQRAVAFRADECIEAEKRHEVAHH